MVSAHEKASGAASPKKAQKQRVLQAKAVLSGLSGASFVPRDVTPGRQSISLDPEQMDHRLPGGGLIKNALHEVRPFDPQDGPAATAFLLGLAARLMNGDAGTLVWIRPQDIVREWGLPYAPGLARFGIAPARVLFIHPRTEQEALWAVEEAVQARGVALTIGDIDGAKLNLTASRRIHLAAEKVGRPALVARGARWRGATAALTRWAVKAAPSSAPDYSVRGIGTPRWVVDLERAKGGRPGSFDVEWNHETHRFRVAAPLADRPAAAGMRAANENIAVA
jgi:protein ImuA